MKTETIIYSDGTEPDVIKRWCCDQRCEQGRQCPAEACTEVGHIEDNENTQGLVLIGIVCFALVVFIAAAVVYHL